MRIVNVWQRDRRFGRQEDAFRRKQFPVLRRNDGQLTQCGNIRVAEAAVEQIIEERFEPRDIALFLAQYGLRE